MTVLDLLSNCSVFLLQIRNTNTVAYLLLMSVLVHSRIDSSSTFHVVSLESFEITSVAHRVR